MEKFKAVAPSGHGTGYSNAQSRKTLIAQRGRILSSGFRVDQYSDPDGYVASVAMVLAQYPDEVIVYVTDPRTGVQRGCKWPPTIAEIVTACDAQMQSIAKVKRFQNWGKNAVPLLEAPRDDRPTIEELKAKYGENWGLDQAPRRAAKKAPDWESIIAEYRANPDRLNRLLRTADDYADDRGEAQP